MSHSVIHIPLSFAAVYSDVSLYAMNKIVLDYDNYFWLVAATSAFPDRWEIIEFKPWVKYLRLEVTLPDHFTEAGVTASDVLGGMGGFEVLWRIKALKSDAEGQVELYRMLKKLEGMTVEELELEKLIRKLK